MLFWTFKFVLVPTFLLTYLLTYFIIRRKIIIKATTTTMIIKYRALGKFLSSGKVGANAVYLGLLQKLT